MHSTFSVVAAVVGLGLFLSVALAGQAATEPAGATDKQAAGETYSPSFSLVNGEHGHYWVMDGKDKVAIFGPSMKGRHTYSLGLIRQFPGQEIPEHWLIEPEVMQFITRRGLGLTTHWMNKAMRGVTPVMKVDDTNPARLTIQLISEKNETEHGTFTVCFTYDAELSRYVAEVEFDLVISERGGGEFCNYYPHGVGDLRPDVDRYDRLIWQEPDGSLKAHRLSFPVQQPGPINLSPTAMVGYVDEEWGSPLVLFESCSPPAKIAVCHCWFDSHLIWTEPADMEGPPYHYRAKLKGYWLDAKESAELIAKAELAALEPFANRWNNMIPIQMGRVNDLEERIDLANGPVKVFYIVMGSGMSYDTKTGHSGNHSILFSRGVSTRLLGPELMVTPGKQLKISAWVKTEGVEGEGFYLETGFQRWLPTGLKNLGDLYQSNKLTGTNDWTKLEIPLPVTPAKTNFLRGRINFVLKGKGKAWVDDVEFTEYLPTQKRP